MSARTEEGVLSAKVDGWADGQAGGRVLDKKVPPAGISAHTAGPRGYVG